MDEPLAQIQVPPELAAVWHMPLTAKELMQYAKISERTFYRLKRAGKLPGRCWGGSMRYRLAEVWTGLPTQRPVVRGSAASSVAAGPGITNLTEYLKRKVKSCPAK